MIIFPLKKVDLFSTKAQDTSASLQALMCWERISKSLFIWRKIGPGTQGTLPPEPTGVSQVFLQLFINHRRPFT